MKWNLETYLVNINSVNYLINMKWFVELLEWEGIYNYLHNLENKLLVDFEWFKTTKFQPLSVL